MKSWFTISMVFLLSTGLYGQQWVDDNTIDSAIASQSGFDDSNKIVVIEFYADFNKDNSFKDRNKLTDVKYYLCDIAKSPKSKKQYRIRMAPTIIIFMQGVQSLKYKAGLDLKCPVTLEEIKKDIAEVKKESQY